MRESRTFSVRILRGVALLRAQQRKQAEIALVGDVLGGFDQLERNFLTAATARGKAIAFDRRHQVCRPMRAVADPIDP